MSNNSIYITKGTLLFFYRRLLFCCPLSKYNRYFLFTPSIVFLIILIKWFLCSFLFCGLSHISSERTDSYSSRVRVRTSQPLPNLSGYLLETPLNCFYLDLMSLLSSVFYVFSRCMSSRIYSYYPLVRVSYSPKFSSLRVFVYIL